MLAQRAANPHLEYGSVYRQKRPITFRPKCVVFMVPRRPRSPFREVLYGRQPPRSSKVSSGVSMSKEKPMSDIETAAHTQGEGNVTRPRRARDETAACIST